MYGDRLDAHLLACPDNAARNLAAIGDQDFPKFACHSHTKVPNPKSQTPSLNQFPDFGLWTWNLGLLLYPEERLAVFDRLAVLYVNLYHLASGFRLNLVHQLHGFDDADGGVMLDVAA